MIHLALPIPIVGMILGGAIVAAAVVFAIRVAWAPLFEEDSAADF